MRATLVLFGGEGVNDTWTWDGKRWALRVPPVSPPARSDPLMAFDPVRGVVVLFGGIGFNDTWTWDGKTWAQQHPVISPVARDSAAMAYDPRTGTVILTGGFDNGRSLNDTWSWNGATWTQLHPQTPPQVIWNAIADDGKRLVAIGVPWGPAAGRYSTQTWVWDGSNWAQLHPAVTLPVDYGYALAGDSSRGTVLFFGGGQGLIHRDTWVWDGSSWGRRHPQTSPPERALGHLAFDSSLGRALLYGGSGADGQWLGDLWAWDGSNWMQLDPGHPAELAGQPTKTAAIPMSPAAAETTIRSAVANTHPLLLPAWLPTNLVEAQVTATEEGFNVYYLSDNRDRQVFLGLIVPNPPPGGPNERTTQVEFLGTTASYHVDDSTDALSHRYLMWIQPGSGAAGAQLKEPGLPYFLSTEGLTDTEFWQVANSLKG